MHMIATWLLLRVIIMYKSFKLLFYGCMRKGSGHVHSLWYCPGFVFIKCSAFLHILLLLVHPSQLLNGLSSLLVSMTVFEFICAQAPRTTQGLLIGLWYATFSIKYLVVGLLENVLIERRTWLICEGVKVFLILVSLVLFSCVSRFYRYRQRDEIVNVQGMIEEIYERRMDQEEEYMQERRAFYENKSRTIS